MTKPTYEELEQALDVAAGVINTVEPSYRWMLTQIRREWDERWGGDSDELKTAIAGQGLLDATVR